MPFKPLVEAGDNIIATKTLYGGTYNFFAHSLPRQGIEVRFIDPAKPEEIAANTDSRTKLVYCESIGNPAIMSLIFQHSHKPRTLKGCH